MPLRIQMSKKDQLLSVEFANQRNMSLSRQAGECDLKSEHLFCEAQCFRNGAASVFWAPVLTAQLRIKANGGWLLTASFGLAPLVTKLGRTSATKSAPIAYLPLIRKNSFSSKSLARFPERAISMVMLIAASLAIVSLLRGVRLGTVF
jgi:hypothetical protein